MKMKMKKCRSDSFYDKGACAVNTPHVNQTDRGILMEKARPQEGERANKLLRK